MLEPLLNQLDGMRIVLASSAKQRAEMLRCTGLKFETCPSNFEEDLYQRDLSFSDFVEQMATGKLQDVYEQLKNDENKPDIIIAVDTMVAHNGRMYGKPKTKEEAISNITNLTQSGIPNQVYTGVAIKYKNQIHNFTEVTTVYMEKIDEKEILAYVETGEPMGKAGGYAIQGIASSFISRIEGDWDNVIGLPLCRITKELKAML